MLYAGTTTDWGIICILSCFVFVTQDCDFLVGAAGWFTFFVHCHQSFVPQDLYNFLNVDKTAEKSSVLWQRWSSAWGSGTERYHAVPSCTTLHYIPRYSSRAVHRSQCFRDPGVVQSAVRAAVVLMLARDVHSCQTETLYCWEVRIQQSVVIAPQNYLLVDPTTTLLLKHKF